MRGHIDFETLQEIPCERNCTRFMAHYFCFDDKANKALEKLA